MRTINILISDIEFIKFGIKSENLNFTELIELVTKELTRQNLNKSLELAEKYGISKILGVIKLQNILPSIRLRYKVEIYFL